MQSAAIQYVSASTSYNSSALGSHGCSRKSFQNHLGHTHNGERQVPVTVSLYHRRRRRATLCTYYTDLLDCMYTYKRTFVTRVAGAKPELSDLYCPSVLYVVKFLGLNLPAFRICPDF